MKLTKEQKDDIRVLLQAYVDRYPSQNKAANSLTGISPATMSAIINGKYDAISDEMFLKLRAQVADSRSVGWQLCGTRLFNQLTTLLEDAQRYQKVAWAVAQAGAGKDSTANTYVAGHENAFMVNCSGDMRCGDFIREMARVVGVYVSDLGLRAALDRTIQYIRALDRPLLIFNEGDKLPDNVLYYFITIYNKLEGCCGMIFLSTDYMRRRLDIGLQYNRRGYDEIYSRIGRQFVEMPAPSEFEVAAITRANGLVDDKIVKAVVKDAVNHRFDLRRVRDLVLDIKRKGTEVVR